MASFKDRYRHDGLDAVFEQVLGQVRPDVVHVGHLNHLSTSLVARAAVAEIPIVFTLHDYWLMCPRGQFMQMFPADPNDLWAACDGQDDRTCAERCYARYFSGDPGAHDHDVGVWTDWVKQRMAHVRAMTELVDEFIAPARYLRDRFIRDFGLPAAKVVYLDYGFDRARFRGRQRIPGEPFTFGYIGTHIPAKGIHHLLKAFGGLSRATRGSASGGAPAAKTPRRCGRSRRRSPVTRRARVEWLPEYQQPADRRRRLQPHRRDRRALGVGENSPLVIHEALQARVPVVTAAYGGMGEYVQHEVNGLLFEHRQPDDLGRAMQRLVDDPELRGG
jgi:glycosyltransferase involved in cell wall biosynthesis